MRPAIHLNTVFRACYYGMSSVLLLKTTLPPSETDAHKKKREEVWKKLFSKPPHAFSMPPHAFSIPPHALFHTC